tara:strand:- start:6581 stop:7141 length:561 start_codon:yes stop_codon:yes gene_type:complete
MKFPTASYNLTMTDFSRLKGFSPREVFEKIFISTGRYYGGVMEYNEALGALREIETKYNGISINEAYLNRNLFEFDMSAFKNGKVFADGIRRNRIYAPFFLSKWEGDMLFGYVFFDPKIKRYSTIVGSVVSNNWVVPPHRPKPTLDQNQGMMGSFEDGVPGGWFSDRLILFPMLVNQPSLNHPEGI